ncbi:hypothetical protein MBLNU230_g2706t1 [Neophaeotheca triangularis]
MWRRLYLALALVRLYFALSPSYIHPDEHFQGPEIIAGEIFGSPTFKTWEFTSDQPIRSVFPLWLVYAPPITVLKWIWEGLGYEGTVPPIVAFYVLRFYMFVLSFVLEDWALHELIPDRREWRQAALLVSSSYVTWTFQTHTFSNSIETLIVLWALVLIARLRDDEQHTQVTACIVLAFLMVLGVFNRITFPVYLVLPVLDLIPHLLSKPFRMSIMLLAGFVALVYALALDTDFYTKGTINPFNLYETAVVTPYNNFRYNLDPSNLAKHGLHPYWQHSGPNLVQLLGPALVLLFLSSRKNILTWSALTGTSILSCFRHQEARFLLPAVPLLLASIKMPVKHTSIWIGSWVIFNILAGVLFGTYHQAGVVPAQSWIAQQDNISHVFWWKTYSPPRWLLDGKNVETRTTDLMGMKAWGMVGYLYGVISCEESGSTLLVAPSSAPFLDPWVGSEEFLDGIRLSELWATRAHIGLDDLDFGDDGVVPTLQRVIGRRGLKVFNVEKKC